LLRQLSHIKDYGEYSNLRFVVDAESSQRGCSQIFFDTGNGYNEQESYSAFVEDGGFQQHVYPLPSKEIKSIRFDPVNISAVVKVRNARIENQHGHVIKTFLPEDFERIQQINKVEISNGILTIYVYKNANDPILIIKNSSINNRIKLAKLCKGARMDNNRMRADQFFDLDRFELSFSVCRSQTIRDWHGLFFLCFIIFCGDSPLVVLYIYLQR